LKNREERDNRQKEYEAAISDIFINSDRTYGPDRVCGVVKLMDKHAIIKLKLAGHSNRNIAPRYSDKPRIHDAPSPDT